MSSGKRARNRVEAEVLRLIKANTLEAYIPHGYSEAQIMGALMLMSCPHQVNTQPIDPEWKAIMDKWVSLYDEAVTRMMER